MIVAVKWSARALVATRKKRGQIPVLSFINEDEFFRQLSSSSFFLPLFPSLASSDDDWRIEREPR